MGYVFRDTTAAVSPANTLPPEAVSINGQYIENANIGYQTLYVSGRENIASEIETITSGIADGEIIKSIRYPSRVITVGFQIIAKSSADFRSYFNKLNQILVSKECKFIFNDEQDKYFIGIPKIETDISSGRNSVTGEWQIYCADPFKYSTTEIILDSTSQYWDSANKQWTNVPYGGTYKTFPKLKVTCPSTRNAQGEQTGRNEYSFFGYTMGDDKILQFGDPTEMDSIDVQYSTKQYINHVFTAFGVFTAESGISLSNGSAYPSNYGSGSGWHGPSMTASVPYDSGDEGAANFSATVTHKMAATKKQYGAISIKVLDNSSTPVVIAEVIVRKSASGTKCNIEYYANGSKFATAKNIAVSKIGATKIIKEAGKITITCGGKTNSNSVTAIASTKAYKVRVTFLQNGSSTTLGTNSVSNVTFNKNKGTYFKEIQNQFQPGDVVNVDCANMSIERNGTSEPNLGALGNDWERFCLVPGNNTIAVYYKGWKNGGTPDSLDFVLSYRERFL